MTSTAANIDKALVTHSTLRSQGSVALYFEYTAIYSMTRDDTADIQVQNLALFAVGPHLLTKRNVGNVTIDSTGATLRTHKTQSSFRNKTTDGSEITAENAFLTVMHAWEFATHRQGVSAMEAKSRDGKVHHLAAGTHALVNEPFMIPIGDADTLALNGEDASDAASTARQIARKAETMWLSLAPASYTPWSDNTPAHRIPGSVRDRFELKSGTLMSNLVTKVAGNDVSTLPVYQPITDTPAAQILPEYFRETAQNRITWE